MTNEFRNPNDELFRVFANRSRMTNVVLRHSSFVILSSLGASSFVITTGTCSGGRRRRGSLTICMHTPSSTQPQRTATTSPSRRRSRPHFGQRQTRRTSRLSRNPGPRMASFRGGVGLSSVAEALLLSARFRSWIRQNSAASRTRSEFLGIRLRRSNRSNLTHHPPPAAPHRRTPHRWNISASSLT